MLAIALLYTLWQRRSTPTEAESPSASPEQAGKADVLNPIVKGAQARSVREHASGKRVGRSSGGSAQTRLQARAQARAHARDTTAQDGSDAGHSSLSPFALEECNGYEQVAAQRGALFAAESAAQPLSSPPAYMAVRSPLSQGSTLHLAAAADTTQGLQPPLVGCGISGGDGAGATLTRSSLSTLLGSPFGAASSPFISLPMPTPPARGVLSSAAGVHMPVSQPMPLHAAPLGRGGGGA